MVLIHPLSYSALQAGPFRLLRQMQEELDRVTGEAWNEVSVGYPAVNVWHSDTEAVVQAELPGLEADAVDITVTGNAVTIKGNRKGPSLDEGKVLRQERSFGSFGRTLQLPFDIDPDRVAASLRNGVLELKLPRRQEELPRKLEVKTN